MHQNLWCGLLRQKKFSAINWPQITINGIETKYEIPKYESVKKRNTNTNQFEETIQRDSNVERELDGGNNVIQGFMSDTKRNSDEAAPRPEVQTSRWPPAGPFDAPENHLYVKDSPLELPPVLQQPGWST